MTIMTDIVRITKPGGRRTLRSSVGFPATLSKPAAHRVRGDAERGRRDVETPFGQACERTRSWTTITPKVSATWSKEP
jgi:hypothetical protein